MSFIKRMLYEPPGGQFREYIGLNAFIEPANLDLYRKLLPQFFEMPQQPIVMIFAADYLKVSPWPLTRYQEWAVLLKCTWDGIEGWHCITMPVTKWIAMTGGRRLGFPKYLAESISVVKQGQGWVASSQFRGKDQLRMEFQPGLTRKLSSWEEELISDDAFFKKGDAFLLSPPSKGPHIKRIHINFVKPAEWSPQSGMVKIRVSREEPWADLLSEDHSYPGSFNHFSGGVNLVELP